MGEHKKKKMQSPASIKNNQSPLSPAMKELGERVLSKPHQISSQLVHQESFQGPIPHPDYVKKYKDLGVWDLVDFLARQSNDRQNQLVASKIQSSNTENQRSLELVKQSKIHLLSQIILSYLGFLVAVGLISVCVFFVYIGKNAWACVFFVSGIFPFLCKISTIRMKK